ncbi:hypothetical protein O181_116089 [Austropuccinia psidii MF-1]|uniref:Uncharacterized protein n=1 Tax=Austropuccinia psidii MF-1 TaxID=1389203 RepID=A0A9Q3K866_9BASI|nr:hypothetical protein [Austropuccinia psidii MF-1]
MANRSSHHFMANCFILVPYGLWAIPPPLATHHILHPLAFRPNFHLTNSHTPFLGAGRVLSAFQGPLETGPYPFNYGVLGHLHPLRPLQPAGHDSWPTVHMLRTVGPSGPFWPKFKEAKEANHQTSRPGGST